MRKAHADIELLAPAGGDDALRAAVANGADAVYLGLDRLNARRGAENFTLEALAGACEFAHLRGVRVYLTANVVILPHEYDGALDYIDRAWAQGVDAVILQDVGLFEGVRQSLPHVRVHASTQVNCHNASTLMALAEMGCARVTLARESDLGSVATLSRSAREVGIETEVFVHGALCVSYSGQCLLSSMIGGRSANRGRCAQPCRLPYTLFDPAGGPVEVPGAHLLSPRDLAAIGLLPDLLAAGVSSLKIEGRMKSAEYVAVVTGVYRQALDRALEDPEAFRARDGELEVLAEAFSRGFSGAYLEGERGNAMMSYQRPNNRGVAIGRVASLEGGVAYIQLDRALSRGDTIEVWTGRGRSVQTVGPLLVDGASRDSAQPGSRAGVLFDQPPGKGDRVFRVRDASLMDAAQRTFRGTTTAPVDVEVSVRVRVGEPLEVALSVADVRVSASGGSIETARTRPVSAGDVIEHVGRFGGTAFSPSTWDVDLSSGAGVGFSELHRVRREAVQRLEDALLVPWRGRRVASPTAPPLVSAKRQRAVRLVAVVGDLPSALGCLEAGADAVHVDAREVGEEVPDGVWTLLPRIATDAEEQALLARVGKDSRVIAGTLGTLRGAIASGALVEAHWSLNVANPHAVSALARMGAMLAWLSPELTLEQVAAVAARASLPIGVAVIGRQEVMVTEHCVLMAAGECARSCAVCARRTGVSHLVDRKGYRFPIRTDRSGRTHVYNAVPLDATRIISELIECGVSSLRMDLELETPQAAAAQVRRVRALIAGGGHDAGGASRDTTSGHFFRGV
jgi:putative protease